MRRFKNQNVIAMKQSLKSCQGSHLQQLTLEHWNACFNRSNLVLTFREKMKFYAWKCDTNARNPRDV